MNPGDETQLPGDTLTGVESGGVPDAATNPDEVHDAVPLANPTGELANNSVQPYDFRNRMLLAPGELRKMRMHQEEFANALSARLSLYLRLEFSLKLMGVQTIPYGKLARGWGNPSHLTLFKVEPLRGVSILEVPPKLGLSIVDRLMGGPGQPPEAAREMSEIEIALLDQAIQLILAEWCNHWAKVKELKPVLLGYETNGKFVQTALPETMMLVISLEARISNCVEQLQIGFPYTSLEVLIRQLTRGAETAAEAAPQPAVKPACKWNPSFDDVRIPMVAEWKGINVTLREVLELKVGDVLPIKQECAQKVHVRLADNVKFYGRLGTVAGNRAVELTQAVKQ